MGYILKIYRDLSLMVKYKTFNLRHIGSNPIGLKKKIIYNKNSYSLMAKLSFSKRSLWVRAPLAVSYNVVSFKYVKKKKNQSKYE